MSSMSSMSDETTDVTVEVEVERHRASGGGEWTRIILNRPEVLNSVNRSMALSLLSALDDAASDSSVRAVMLSARGRGFCAGQDLSDVSPDEDLGAVLRERYIPCVRLMRTMDKPTIAVVNGVAAGAGANLALSADVVLASDRASFSQAFARIGLIPDAGGTWFLPRLVGSARALGLSLTAESLSAERAESWGLIWRCVPDDELESESVSLAERFADGPDVRLRTCQAGAWRVVRTRL